MTEAMSRREIEDILTSIRKLVSHDPATLGTSAAAPSVVRDTAHVGKLVLTPALRVADEPVSSQMTDDLAPPDDETPLFATAAAPEDTFLAPDGADVAPTHAIFDPTDDGTSASLLARISRSASHPVSEADHNAVTTNTVGNIDAAPQMAPPPIADIQDWLDDADIPVPADPAGVDTHFDQTDGFSDPRSDGVLAPDADSLEDTLARLEAVLSGTPTTAPVNPAPQAVPTPQADAQHAATGDPENGDTAMIDEAMLYQLVANIVRQELQGELGEKITRAIRKLVRSEVARELQLRNL